MITSHPLSNWNMPDSLLDVLNDDTNTIPDQIGENRELFHLFAITHSIWHHSNFSQLTKIPGMIRDKLIPIVRNEEQLLFVYHLIGPLLERFFNERLAIGSLQPLVDLTTYLYKMLREVDKVVKIKNLDIVCDYLYHVKYQFAGDKTKSVAETIIKDLRPELQARLKFIAPKALPQVSQKQEPQMLDEKDQRKTGSKTAPSGSNAKIIVDSFKKGAYRSLN